MICPVCSKRYAPRAIEEWTIIDGKDGEGFIIKPVNPKVGEKYQELLDSDFKCPCRSCSFS